MKKNLTKKEFVEILENPAIELELKIILLEKCSRLIIGICRKHGGETTLYEGDCEKCLGNKNFSGCAYLDEDVKEVEWSKGLDPEAINKCGNGYCAKGGCDKQSPKIKCGYQRGRPIKNPDKPITVVCGGCHCEMHPVVYESWNGLCAFQGKNN